MGQAAEKLQLPIYSHYITGETGDLQWDSIAGNYLQKAAVGGTWNQEREV